MEKIIITGSNGFIGSHLVDFCINKGHNVFALDRPSASFYNLNHYTDGKSVFTDNDKLEFTGERIQYPSNNPNLILLECDIKNNSLLEKLIRELKPTIIFHFGAQPYILPSWEDPIDTIETNVIGTINIFEPIKKYKLDTKVILACTAGEFGTTTTINRPLKETDPLLAVHPYGISKIAAELLARQYYINFGIEIINVRFFNQTGIRRTNDVTSDFIKKIVQIDLELTEPIIEVGNLEPYRDFTDIKDTLEGIWLVTTKGTPGETYHICSNKKTQIRELLKICLNLSNKKIEVKENVSSKMRKTDEDIIIGDNSKIKKELGWDVSISLKETLKKMYEYWMVFYKNNMV